MNNMTGLVFVIGQWLGVLLAFMYVAIKGNNELDLSSEYAVSAVFFIGLLVYYQWKKPKPPLPNITLPLPFVNIHALDTVISNVSIQAHRSQLYVDLSWDFSRGRPLRFNDIIRHLEGRVLWNDLSPVSFKEVSCNIQLTPDQSSSVMLIQTPCHGEGRYWVDELPEVTRLVFDFRGSRISDLWRLELGIVIAERIHHYANRVGRATNVEIVQTID